jgi:carbonic anhydrase
MTMQRLIEGFQRFRTTLTPARAAQLARLAEGQHPEALLITCSDSRVDPHVITGADLGDLFVLRNAGNIVPAYGTANGGEEATIEYAVMALRVKHIIVCGHTHCGAMKGLLHPESLGDLPAVASFLRLAGETRKLVAQKHAHLQGPALVEAAAAENVLVQLRNLQTLPAVASALARGQLDLHGWLYRIESGELLEHNAQAGRFLPVGPSRLPVES